MSNQNQRFKYIRFNSIINTNPIGISPELPTYQLLLFIHALSLKSN